MPATYNLGTTTFAAPVGRFDSQVKVASTSGLKAGSRLFVDTEMMLVLSLDVSTLVNVRRGSDGTAAAAHGTDVTVYSGDADWFHFYDPIGRPRNDMRTNPWINVINGSVWYAEGDSDTGGQRWFQKQVIGHGIGPLGVRTLVPDPSSST